MRTLVFAFCSVVWSVNAGELKLFTSDGCSVFPDGTLSEQELWLSCCTAHDLAYWQGGTELQRLEADQQLESCVAEVGQPEIAKLMLMGVRVGGSPYLPTQFRWGYGWPYPREYKALTPKELALVEEKSKQYFESLNVSKP